MEAKEEGCTRDLDQQEWYWADASKDEVASVISDCPSGTFCVRNASTRGNYTLTLRYGDRNILIKIIVSGEQCGFTEDMLKFDSVVALIEYYQRNSLLEYNQLLPTELLYPLGKSDSQQTFWVIDGRHSVEHLLCQLRGLHAEHLRILRHYDEITAELDLLREELQKKRQSHAALTAAHAVFVEQINKLEMNKKELVDEFEVTVLNKNRDAQQERLKSIRFHQQNMIKQIEEIEKHIKENEAQRCSLNPMLSSLHKELKICQFRLTQLHFSQIEADRLMQEVSFLADLEQPSLSQILLKLSLKWQPDRYLCLDHTKDAAFKVIRSLMDCNPDKSDGIFLIRPSESQAGQYALTVSNDNHIYNCLIEYRDLNHPESSGYAFLNTKIIFPTLVDFVRYYSHFTMEEHNPLLETKLRMPAFKGTI